ncbi:MAG TPA: cyclic nucleotide-binding domain-containing protein [Dehalococcoidia bacterium]|nr:cyclic nucleotide-binding domain-containing protein [Dehalococcoidia bacterium]
MNKLEVLRRSDLFRELTDEQLSVVEKMCTSEVFEQGTIICKQGRMEDKVYIVEEGLVGIILEVGPLAQRQVQAVCNFETFGWSAMIPPYTCTATAKTIEKTSVLAFNGQKLCDLCLTKPEIGCRACRAVARVVATRLRQAYTQLLGVTSQD